MMEYITLNLEFPASKYLMRTQLIRFYLLAFLNSPSALSHSKVVNDVRAVSFRLKFHQNIEKLSNWRFAKHFKYFSIDEFRQTNEIYLHLTRLNATVAIVVFLVGLPSKFQMEIYISLSMCWQEN